MIDSTLSKSDAEPLARLHQRAFPGFFLSRLGVRFLVQFYRGFVDDPTAVVAVLRDDAGSPKGVVVGTTRPERFFSRLLLRRLPGFMLASTQAALRDPRAVPRLASAIFYRGDAPEGSGGALLSSICLDTDQQGRGLGRELLDAWAVRAREMGAETAYLTTDAVDNEGVNRLYRKSGWHLVDQFSTPQGRLMNRYRRELGSDRGEETDGGWQ